MTFGGDADDHVQLLVTELILQNAQARLADATAVGLDIFISQTVGL